MKRRNNAGEEHLVGTNWGEDNIPVLESQELAFRYFEKAAKLGHGLSMQSLGMCFDDGVGCRRTAGAATKGCGEHVCTIAGEQLSC